MTRWELFCQNWPMAWIEIAENIIWLFTLGQWKPMWSFDYMFYCIYKQSTKRKALAEKEELA